MKRRSILKSAALLPAAAALPPPAPAQAPTQPAADNLKLEVTQAAAAAEPVVRFFTPDEFAALRKLGELFVPALEQRPGAVEAGAPEFLDFYISQSSGERQKLYRDGLDRLNADARKHHGKLFSELVEPEAANLLKPVSEPWTYAGPSDAFTRFLLAARDDLMRATVNSREYPQALSATTRRAGGTGYYWYPIE